MLCLFYTPWYAALWWPILFRVLLVFKFSSVECVNVRFKCVYLLCVFGVWYPPVFQVYFSPWKVNTIKIQNTEKKLILKNSRPKSVKKTFLFKPMYQVAEAIKINKMITIMNNDLELLQVPNFCLLYFSVRNVLTNVRLLKCGCHTLDTPPTKTGIATFSE